MAAVFSGEEILDITKGRLVQGSLPDDEVGEVATDSRDMPQGAWFLALEGRTYDGHNFLADAFNAGALGCIVAERVSYPISSPQFPLIAVEDTEAAYAALARNWRRRLRPRVVLVAGRGADRVSRSARLIISLLSRSLAHAPGSTVLVVSHSQRLEGMAATLLSLEPDTRILVVDYVPACAEDVRLAGQMLEPSLLLLPVGAFADLRLTEGDSAVGAVLKILQSFVDRHSCLVAATSTYGVLEADAEKHRQLELFDSSALLNSQEGEGLTSFGIVGSDERFVLLQEGYLAIEDIWLAVMALRRLGMSDAEIASELHYLTVEENLGADGLEI